MYKFAMAMLLTGLAACGGGEKTEPKKSEEPGAFDFGVFSEKFQKASLPYQLSDAAFAAAGDTSTIRNPTFLAFIPDSITTRLFRPGARVSYRPLASVETGEGQRYFVVIATSGSQAAALLLAFHRDGSFGAAFPFLQPDADPATTQVSSLEKSGTVTRSLTRRMPEEANRDGKDVYMYSPEQKAFTLIMTDALENDAADLINPIDTLPRTRPYAGDYTKDKKNIVSIRDARGEREFNFFIHIEKGEDCTGELKGTALMTSSKTAVFRQGGNPCVMEFTFSGSSVTIKEQEGCGSQRGIGCTFDGTFARKKGAPAKKGAAGKAKPVNRP